MSMKKELYLGNGCLNATIEENMLYFYGWSIVTTMEVSFSDYTPIRGGKVIENTWSEYIPCEDSNERKSEKTLEIKLNPGGKCIVRGNALNQIESYIQFENKEGDITFNILAEESFYMSDFQGHIMNKTVTEEEFRNYIKSL